MQARDGGVGEAVEGNEMMVDAACVICYAEVVDTVLMPCRHMVVCGVGFLMLLVGGSEADVGRRVVIGWV